MCEKIFYFLRVVLGFQRVFMGLKSQKRGVSKIFKTYIKTASYPQKLKEQDFSFASFVDEGFDSVHRAISRVVGL